MDPDITTQIMYKSAAAGKTFTFAFNAQILLIR